MANVTLTVKTVCSDVKEITIELSCTVLDLKKKIESELSIPLDVQKLIFCGRMLEDTQILSDLSMY